jgi:hypothetical protein
VFSRRRRDGTAQPMRQIGAEALLAPQIEATYRLRYRQGGFTLGDIRIEVCQLSLFAAFGHGEGKECFPKTIARLRAPSSPALARRINSRFSLSLSLFFTTLSQLSFFAFGRRPVPQRQVSKRPSRAPYRCFFGGVFPCRSPGKDYGRDRAVLKTRM